MKADAIRGQEGFFPYVHPQGVFPEASQDSVIQIASMVTVLGQDTPIVRNIMTLNTCAPILGAEVMSFPTEQEMFRNWVALLIETDPDVIIGYNIINFDLPYLYERAQALGIANVGFAAWLLDSSRASLTAATFIGSCRDERAAP